MKTFQNKFTNDNLIEFDPVAHRYYFDGKRVRGATTLCSQFHEEFDIDFHSKRVAERDGVTQEEILEKWEQIRDEACDWGSSIHNTLEHDFSELLHKPDKWNEVSKEVYRVIDLPLEKLEVLTEQVIFNEDLGIAGVVDLLLISPKTGAGVIIDYKTNKRLDTYSYGKYFYDPFEFLALNNMGKYTFQIATYKNILERNHIYIKDYFIIHINRELLATKVMLSNYMVQRIEHNLYLDLKVLSAISKL